MRKRVSDFERRPNLSKVIFIEIFSLDKNFQNIESNIIFDRTFKIHIQKI